MFEAKNFDYLLGLNGFSDSLLKNHFSLYQGYVNNSNKLLASISETDSSSPSFSELKRRFAWEFNGMRLHELYFENMSKNSIPLNSSSHLYKIISSSFGSFEKWEKDFKATGAMRGIGWVVLYKDVSSKHLFNCWINEHDVGHLAGAIPLLVMDVFEHAFMIDYGLKRVDYITAFFNSIDWNEVEKRL